MDGFSSRKMIMAYVAMLATAAGFAASGVWPALVAAYPTYLMGILAATGIYTGTNVLEKHLLKAPTVVEDEPTPPAT
jgi:hypothetical protein